MDRIWRVSIKADGRATMDKRQTVLKLVGRVLAVLIILWVSSLVTRYVDRVIGQTETNSFWIVFTGALLA